MRLMIWIAALYRPTAYACNPHIQTCLCMKVRMYTCYYVHPSCLPTQSNPSHPAEDRVCSAATLHTNRKLFRLMPPSFPWDEMYARRDHLPARSEYLMRPMYPTSAAVLQPSSSHL